MPNDNFAGTKSPILVGICSWILPGAGYWLLRQRSRAIAVGASIVGLYLLGIVVGGIRVADPPGWGQYGYRVQIVERTVDRQIAVTRVDPVSIEQQANPIAVSRQHYQDRAVGWALLIQPIAEIGEKPWSVGQILCGPISLLTSAVSVSQAHPRTSSDTGDSATEGVATSHSRSWEIGTLYTAVAGMLNLLVIIDSIFRAAKPDEEPSQSGVTSSRGLLAGAVQRPNVEVT